MILSSGAGTVSSRRETGVDRSGIPDISSTSMTPLTRGGVGVNCGGHGEVGGVTGGGAP